MKPFAAVLAMAFVFAAVTQSRADVKTEVVGGDEDLLRGNLQVTAEVPPGAVLRL